MTIRKTVIAELQRRKWTPYHLVKIIAERGGSISPDTVYKFLAGSRGITDKFLEPILDALGLEVRRKRGDK